MADLFLRRSAFCARVLLGFFWLGLPLRARVARIRERLREVYGVPCQPPHEDPLGELVQGGLDLVASPFLAEVAGTKL